MSHTPRAGWTSGAISSWREVKFGGVRRPSPSFWVTRWRWRKPYPPQPADASRLLRCGRARRRGLVHHRPARRG